MANLNGVFATAEPVISVPQAAGLSDSALFSVDDADWKSVPAMIEQAKIKIEIPDGQIVEPIILEKPTYDADAQPACWTVRAKDSDGENGEVTFDTKGKVVHVLLPKSRRPAVSMFDPTTARDTIALSNKFGAHAPNSLSFGSTNTGLSSSVGISVLQASSATFSTKTTTSPISRAQMRRRSIAASTEVGSSTSTNLTLLCCRKWQAC